MLARKVPNQDVQPGAVVVTWLEAGSTAECLTCGTTVVVVTGSSAQLWCHNERMRAVSSVRCSEPVQPRVAGGLEVGALYADPATSSTVRCTRAGSGWPTSASRELIPVMACRSKELK